MMTLLFIVAIGLGAYYIVRLIDNSLDIWTNKPYLKTVQKRLSQLQLENDLMKHRDKYLSRFEHVAEKWDEYSEANHDSDLVSVSYLSIPIVHGSTFEGETIKVLEQALEKLAVEENEKQ